VTLNITVFGKGWLAQASDRRLSDPKGIAPPIDNSNKLIVVVAVDGTLLITYTGVGAVRRSPSTSLVGLDLLLAEWLQDHGAAALSTDAVVAEVLEFANSMFPRFGDPCPHWFSAAGFVSGRNKGKLWAIHNVKTGSPSRGFTAFTSAAAPGDTVVTGAVPAVGQTTKRRLRARLKQVQSSDDVARALVDAIRESAESERGETIGRDCIVAALTSDGKCAVAGFSVEGEPLAISPTLLWSTEAESVLVTGITVTSTAYGVLFGTPSRQIELLIGRMRGRLVNGPLPDGAIEAKFRIGKLGGGSNSAPAPRRLWSIHHVG